MEIEVGGVSLDLFGDEDVSVDYTIFPISNITDRTVSYTNEFSIPRTDRNVSLIDPIVNATSKFECRIFGDNIEMNGIMYVEDSDINRIGETYTVSIVDGMIDKLNLLDDGIENLVDNTTDAFLWEFIARAGITTPVVAKGYVPNYPVEDKFFMVTANFNGESYKDFEDNYPVYPAKLNDDKTQMLWGFRFDKFINMCMDYAALDFNTIGEYDLITDDIKYSELSVNINAPFIGMRDRSVDFMVDEHFNQNTSYLDSFRQLEDALLQTDPDYNSPMISKGDTTYNGMLTFQIETRMIRKGVYFYYSNDTYSDDFSCVPAIVIYSGGAEVFRYTCENQVSTRPSYWVQEHVVWVSGTTIHSATNIPIPEFITKSANDIVIGVEFEIFGRITRWDSGTITDFAGSYKIDDAIFSEEDSFVMQLVGVDYPDTFSGTQYARLTLDWVSSQNPAIENKGTSDTDLDANTDYIYPEESLAATKYKMSDLINGIINRFGLGVWEDDQEVLHIGRIYDRYTETLDLSKKILEEEMTIVYSRDINKTFEYKNNKVDNNENMFTIDDEDYMLGDIIEYEVNEAGEINESIQLDTIPAYRDLYGDKKESGIDQANLAVHGIERWGGSYNEQLDRETIGVSHGFFSTNKQNILQGGVHYFDYILDSDGVANPDFWVDYTFRGSKSENGVLLSYPEMSTESNGRSILAGDVSGVAINNDLLNNFGIEDTNARFKEIYTIPTFLTNTEINTIRRGAKIIAGDNEYVPISIKGVSFDDEGSYVTLEMVSGSIFKTLGDFNSDFNNDFLIE